MNSTVIVMINQVVIMFMLMLVGATLYKTNKIDNNGSAQLSYIVLYVSSPLLVLQSMMVPFEKNKLITGIIVFIIAMLLHVMAMIIMKLIYKDTKRLCQFGVIFSNSGFLGMPLVENVLGADYIFYISIFLLAFNLLAWTYGVFLISNDKKEISFRKILTNPCILSIFIGIIIFVCNIKIPSIFIQTFRHLAIMNTGLAMMVIGIFLAQTDFIKMFKNKDLWLICLFRLLIIPFITLLAMRYIPISTEIKIVILIGYAAPSAGMLAMLSQKYGEDYKYGAGIVGVTTTLSLLTMPLLIRLLYII